MFLSVYANAQIEQSARLEIPLEGNDHSGYRVVSAGEFGLIAYRSIDLPEGPKIELSRLDTALQEVWHGFISTEKRLTLLYAQVYGNMLSLLLKGTNYTSGDFLIINIRLEKGNYTTHIVKNAIPFNPTQYVVNVTTALIGGYFNNRPLAVYFDFTRQQSKVLPGFFNEPGELDQVSLHADGSIDIMVSAKNPDRQKCLWLRNYNSEGILNKTVVITPEDKKNLLFARAVQSSQGEQIVCGVYGRYADYSRGIFMAVISAEGEYKIRYYSFAELHNFFKYMKASRERRIMSRIERRKIKGKRTRFNYRMMIHDLIPYNNQFVMLGEAFYPHYSYASRSYGAFTTISRYSNPVMREGMVFDGYQYTHAVVIGFDNDGNLAWDNSFEVTDVRTMQLEQFVKIQAERERIILLYLHENILRSKIIRGSEVVEGKSENNLVPQTAAGKVKVKDVERSKLDYWYNDYFFASGIRSVRTTPVSGIANTRKVFFINKITYK